MTVHAIGVSENGEHIEYARNGNPGKCRGKDAVGTCGCVHAEIRLLKKMPNPHTVTLSHSPCLTCARALVFAGVKKVMFLKEYRNTDGIQCLLDNHVAVMNLYTGKGEYYPEQSLDYITVELKLDKEAE
jgi:deoxycytidylate deaminase